MNVVRTLPGETAQERSVGSWEGYDEQGLGMPRAAWPGPPLLPGNCEGGDPECQSSPSRDFCLTWEEPGPPQSSRRGREAWLRAPPQHLPQGKGRLEEGVGVSLEEGDRVRGVGARGRTAWCQGQRGGLVWALKARKGEAGAGVAGHPHLGWKNSELFRSCLAPAVPLGVPCPKLESARTINA